MDSTTEKEAQFPITNSPVPVIVAAPYRGWTYKPAPGIGESPTRPGVFQGIPLVVHTPAKPWSFWAKTQTVSCPPSVRYNRPSPESQGR